MTSTISPIYIKTGVAAISGAVLDRFICGEQDMYQNLYFGLSTGAGVGIGSYISSLTPAFLPDDTSGSNLYTGRGVMDRTFEIGGGLATTYIVSKYINKNSYNCPITTKLLVAVASDVIAEYAKDYFTTQPMAFLS